MRSSVKKKKNMLGISVVYLHAKKVVLQYNAEKEIMIKCLTPVIQQLPALASKPL